MYRAIQGKNYVGLENQQECSQYKLSLQRTINKFDYEHRKTKEIIPIQTEEKSKQTFGI